jgi:pyruvate kinase
MDLAGPKLRTGPIEPGAAVLKLRPGRDTLGRTVAPARAWLTSSSSPSPAPAGCAAALPVDGAWLARLEAGDELTFHDARGAERLLAVVKRTRGGALVELHSTSYFVPGLSLRKRGVRGAAGQTAIGALPRQPGALELELGDRLVLTRSLEPGRPAQRDARGRLLAPARIGCTLPEVFQHARAGESVWLDDGKIGGRIVGVSREQLEVEITSARAGGDKLRADKGINLPDTDLAAPALTAKDLADLPFVVEHADAVALSFVHAPEDVAELEQRLAELGRPDLGIVLKIETRRAFERLPQLLLASMQSPCDGVMIARGDLAVECGFERLAEVQEEILWICEAAHVPVIWATQVLETLAREGRPSRAEITDAAMSERAECVMLNKGPHIDQALSVLDDILRRMQGHQRKKSAMLRPLGLARRPFA